MAMSANTPLSPPPVSAPSAADNGEASHKARRRNLPSPWVQVVRGVESESTAATVPLSPSSPSPSSPPVIAACPERTPFTVCSGQKASTENLPPETQRENSDNSDGNAGRPKKPAWNKPLNGVVQPSSVMGGSISWPALSESTRPPTKSSCDSLKPLSNGSASSSQGPIITQTPQKQVNTNSNHGMHRQRSMKHRGGGSGSSSGPGGGSAQGGYNRTPPPPPPPPLPPAFPVIEIPPYGSYGNFMPPPVFESSARGPRLMGAVGPQSGNDHSSHAQRNSSRRSNFGPRPRGDGQYHNNHGRRRDSDRRDVQVPHQFIPHTGSYIPAPPPPGSAPFIPPPPHMRPFVGPMSFDVASPFIYVPTLPPEPFRGMPLIAQAPPPPMFFPVVDPPLPALIIKQIDYYFSDANLVKDDYLRSNMDDEGWVPISLIASFPRVQQLTTDVQLILDSLRASVLVEVKEQGDKIRRRNEWQKWLHTGGRVSPDAGSQIPGASSDDNLTTSIDKLSLNDESCSKTVTIDTVDSQMEMVSERPLPEESSCPSNVDNGELTVEDVRSSQT